MTRPCWGSARWLILLACFALLGCPSPQRGALGSPKQLSSVVDPMAPPGAPTLFIALPDSPNFLEVRRSLVSEVQKSFKVETLLVTPELGAEQLGAAILRANPACVVLMNNPTMGLLSRYELAHPSAKFPATVLLMASFVEAVAPSLKNATGIVYEVPGVIAFVNLRAIITRPVRRIGVVYRPNFRALVAHQAALAAREHIELVAVPVPSEVNVDNLHAALETVVERHVDAVWMLNDNALVGASELRDDAWRDVLNEAKLPLIVGAANLVDPSSPLGTIAVVPDHEALGLQAANLIFELQTDDWKAQGKAVELPLSVKTVVDVKTARDNFGLRPNALQHIDRALE